MRISDWSSDVCSADLDELQVRRRDRCPCSGTGPQIDWILETHAHADHLSAAPYLQEKLGGKLVIGREIVTVQGVFGSSDESRVGKALVSTVRSWWSPSH